MNTLAERSNRWTGLATLGIMALLLAIPFAAARLNGEAFVCGDGFTPMAILLMAEIGAVALAVVAWSVAEGKWQPAKWVRQIAQERTAILIALALVSLPFLIAALTGTSVCERGKAFFWQSILIETFILAIMAISYNLLFGFTGVVSFGHAAFFGVGAYAVGILATHYGLPFWSAVLATLALGVIIALIMGVVGLRLKGLYFAMFTLAFAEVLYLLASNRIMVDLTGAEDGLTYAAAIPDLLNATKNRLFMYYFVLSFLILSYMIVHRLMHSPTGRVLNAIRDNENRAQMLGYNTFHYKLIATVMSGLIATTAGLLMGIFNKGANTGHLGVGRTVDALLQTIIGGMGTFAGPVVGTFGLHLLRQALLDASVTLGETTIEIGRNWALILGVIFVLAVLAFPQGLVGTFQGRRLYTLGGRLRWLGLRQNPVVEKSKQPEQVDPSISEHVTHP